MITCKTCSRRFDELSVNEIEIISFDFTKLIEHTKQTGHHTYKIQGLNMELNVG